MARLEIEDFEGRRILRNHRSGIWIYKLDKDFQGHLQQLQGFSFSSRWLHLDGEGGFIIREGYSWDGCTPKFRFFDLGYWGIPDGTTDPKTAKPKAWLASLVHDVLYQYYGSHGVPRKVMDQIFLQTLKDAGFSLAYPYYLVVKLLGWIFFVGHRTTRVGQAVYYLQALPSPEC